MPYTEFMHPTITKFHASDFLLKEDSNVKREVLSLSLDYFLACISQEYSKGLKEHEASQNELEKFNDLNKLGFSKIIVYPFFVAISSNDFSKSLYNLFGPFKTFNFGPGSESMLLAVKPDSNYPKLTNFSIDIKNDPTSIHINKDSIQSFVELKERIKGTKIKEGNIAFKDFEIEGAKDSFTPIYKAIETGVENLQHATKNQFFKATKTEILNTSNHLYGFSTAHRKMEENELGYDSVPKEKSFLSRLIQHQ